MARARLHLICGNCGCADEWEWDYTPEKEENGEIMQDEDVFLRCNNCSTLHSLNDKGEKAKILI